MRPAEPQWSGGCAEEQYTIDETDVHQRKTRRSNGIAGTHYPFAVRSVRETRPLDLECFTQTRTCRNGHSG